MDQASRIIAQWNGIADLISHERVACAAWKKAVGKRLATRTNAFKLVRDRLVIEVEDEVWRNNLYSLRPQISAISNRRSARESSATSRSKSGPAASNPSARHVSP